MKTALLHYWLTNMRGGENVFREICNMFPEGDVFTHALGRAMRDQGVEGPGGDGRWCGRRVHESFIASMPLGRLKPQLYLSLMPMASRRFNLDGYDLIISSESGPIKGIVKPKGARHVCYCHTPMRYLYDMYDDYYRMAGLGGKIAMGMCKNFLRKEDLKSAESVDVFVANSKFVAERIKRIYGRESTVVYPSVDYEFFASAAARPESAPYQGDGYYLLAGQLISYKRTDMAVAACVKMNRKLKVVGCGNQLKKLQKLAAGNSNVEFLGHVGSEELRDAYAKAKALLFPGIEDFGIVPVEAQAAGTPVIAYGAGGALETVVDGDTGLFFHEQSVDGLCGAIEEFESRRFVPDACRANAARFAKSEFVKGMAMVL